MCACLFPRRHAAPQKKKTKTESKARYRACLTQTGSKPTFDLIFDQTDKVLPKTVAKATKTVSCTCGNSVSIRRPFCVHPASKNTVHSVSIQCRFTVHSVSIRTKFCPFKLKAMLGALEIAAPAHRWNWAKCPVYNINKGKLTCWHAFCVVILEPAIPGHGSF